MTDQYEPNVQTIKKEERESPGDFFSNLSLRWKSEALINLLSLLLLIGTLFLMVPQVIPAWNERTYLITLKQHWNPNFIQGDWSLSQPDARHYIFNALFGWPTLFLSLTVVGWIGRIFTWSLLLWSWFRLGKHFRIPLWMISGSLILCLFERQSLVADEWMFGTFEAKGIAYAFLLFSLDGFLKQQWFRSAMLLGISFSLHPAIGFWGGIGIGGMLLFSSISWKETFQAAALVILFALPGALPILLLTESAGSEELFFQIVHWMPRHFDPSTWSLYHLGRGGLMLVFSLIVMWEDQRLRQLSWFLCGLALCFGLGVLAYHREIYEFVILMPFRLFDVFIIPLFCLSVARFFDQLSPVSFTENTFGMGSNFRCCSVWGYSV